MEVRCHFDGALNEPGGALALGGVPDAYTPGLFEPADDRTDVALAASSAIQYAHHTEEGTLLAVPDTARWTFAWTAPDTTAGRIVFHVAANAANDDASEFGDFIYAGTWESHGGERRK